MEHMINILLKNIRRDSIGLFQRVHLSDCILSIQGTSNRSYCYPKTDLKSILDYETLEVGVFSEKAEAFEKLGFNYNEEYKDGFKVAYMVSLDDIIQAIIKIES